MSLLRTIFCYALIAYEIVLFTHVILSWVPRPPEPIMPLVRGVRGLVEPVAAPLRRAIPPLQMGGIGLDLSILVIFLAIYLLQLAVC